MRKNCIGFVCMLMGVHAMAQSLTIENLQCDLRHNPLGVEAAHPSLSWQLSSPLKNISQTAYRILVSDDSSVLLTNKGNTWDSKKVQSNNSRQLHYAGKKLMPAATYYWKVTVWDNQHHTATSAIHHWQMGLPEQKDWGAAQWIAYNILPDSSKIIPAMHGNGKKAWGKRPDILPMFRKTFSVQKKISNASLFISGLGHFEAYLNGNKLGDHFLDPGWTKYDKQAMYVVFDVTRLLHNSNNTLGVMLGNGFLYIPGERYRKLTGAYGYPKMICRLVIKYTDGSAAIIVSDESWRTAESPIVFSSIYGGEDYDATKEQPGWATPSFNNAGWRRVLLTDGPQLVSQKTMPLKIMQVFKPATAEKISDSSWVYDTKQNMSGIPRITVRGKRGDTVRIFTAELRNGDGTVNQKASGSPNYYIYILKGNGMETWQPRFTYYGFRYIQVNGAAPAGKGPSSLPVIISVEGLHTRNAAEQTGSFHCSNELFNKTAELIDWSIKSNMVSVFTDCPHREKLGWLEQTYLMGSSVKFRFDIATICSKMIGDMQSAQTDKGLIPEIAPEYVKFDEPFRDSPEWGSAAIILPWYVYQWYGNNDVLEANYGMMQQYINYLHSKDSSYLLMQGLGDWYDIGPARPGLSQNTPGGLTATATYYYDLQLLEKIALVLNKPGDAANYRQWSEKVKQAFNNTYFNKQTKQYGGGSQTSNAMALYMGLAEEKDRKPVLDNLVADIRARNNALTAGDIGYRYVLKALAQSGRADVIYDMNNRSDVPGYGYQLAHGATALTESWQALTAVSNNHFMLGHILEWFYEGLAGIGQPEDGAGFSKIIIRPQPVGDVTKARASFQSPYGLIVSDWKKEAGNFELKVAIPANTTAEIYLPATGQSVITVDGKKQEPAYWKDGYAVIKTGSGNYRFLIR